MAIFDIHRPLAWLLAGAMLALATACTPTGDPPALGGNRAQFNDGSDGTENSDLGGEAPSLAARDAEEIVGE